jgi:hypothetical protein
MFEQMEEATDRCWAYNQSGQRCEMIAGHDRDHNVVIAWTNDECWVPGTEFTPTFAPTPPGEVEHLVRVPKASGKCVICSHRMHDGPCGADDSDGFECDCANGVEE